MLHFIIGRAGTGKTTRLVELMRDGARKGKAALFIVPEQFSFEAEKKLYRALGPRLSSCVEVLSFTRLCNSVFRSYGGVAGAELNRQAKILLMSVAVEQLRESFRVYRQSAANTAFLETMLGVVGELQAAGVAPERLADFAESCEKPLGDKLCDISAVYTAWEALVERGYRDGDDALIRACAMLENNSFFAGKTVFVDGFSTFMAAEFELLGHAISQTEDIVFAFTADGILDNERGLGVFSAAKSAMNRLCRIAEKNGVGTSEPEVLDTPRRYSNPALAELSRRFFQAAGGPAEIDGRRPELFGAQDAHAEAVFISSEIARLVRDEGLRYSEIAVVARDPEPYLSVLEAVFPRYGIPYFAGTGYDIEDNPIVSVVMSALDAVDSGFDTSDVLMFAKSPLLGLDPGAVAALENYCYLWDVRGALWHGEFRNSPRGLSGRPGGDESARLAEINAAREAIAGPLLRLREGLRGADGRGFAVAMFALLEEIGAVEHLHDYAEKLGPRGHAFIAESAQVWDELVSILDIFGSVLGGQATRTKRLCELFRLAVRAAEVLPLPRTLDQVLVGAADRIRPADVRAAFIIGANEGVFPAQPAETGVFSDSERRRLIEAGIGVSAPLLERAALENTFAYLAVTMASERLFVSFRKSQNKGGEMLPSSIVTGIREIFGEDCPPVLDPLCGIAGGPSAFAALAARLGEDSPLAASLRESLAGTADLERLNRAASPQQRAIRDGEVASELFGRRLRLSPTRVEQYYRCPFSYFAREGLRLQARRRAEYSPLSSGDLLHHVLQAFLQRHGVDGLTAISEGEMRQEIDAIIREYLCARLEDESALPARQKYLFERMSGLLLRVLRRLGEEFAQSMFRPFAYELGIAPGGGVEPLLLKTPDGVEITVEGKIDRLDIMEKNGKRYIRVVDYKSGEKKFALAEVLYGLNLQMLLYLFTVAANGTGGLEGAIPAAALYMPLREKFQSAARGASGDEMAETRRKMWRMDGLLLDDREVLRGMEREIAGIYIPVKLGKNGEPSARSSLVNAAEMGRLSQKVGGLVTQMASALGRGAIEACPALHDGTQQCEYCDYSSVCGFEAGDPVRAIAKIDRDEFFNMLEKEDDAGA